MLGVSVLAGFALADIPAPCLSVVAVGAGEAGRAAAERAVTALADAIWANRDGFYYRSEPLADSLARAARLAEGARSRCCCWIMATTACRAAPATPWTC